MHSVSAPNACAYRRDIDGLRAVAVLGVILCHAGAQWLPGGFLGVDIFFVISGFLITNIISHDLAYGSFSFAAFYARRIKRLVPALVLMLLATVLLGWLLLTPDHLSLLAAETFAAAGYAANLYLVRNRGYFEPSAQTDPLLHTWSLGVEEQFYLLWPAVIWLWSRYRGRPRTLVAITGVAFLLSFAGANWALLSQHPFVPRLAYYSLPTRAWELLAGALTAFGVQYYRGRHAHKLSILGCLLIGYAFSGLEAGALIPGVHALIPVTGTVLLLLTGVNAGLANRLLAHRYGVALGLMSYSLYLWHWPVLAYVTYIYGGVQAPLPPILAALLIIVLLSWSSWKFVETPLRVKNYSLRTVFRKWALAPVGCAGVLYLSVTLTHGAEFRYRDSEKLTRQFLFLDAKYCHDQVHADCNFGMPQKAPTWLLFGDSNAAQLSPFWDKLAREAGAGITIQTVSSCYPLLNTRNHLPANDPSLYRPLQCRQLLETVSNQIAGYDTVILAGAWRNYTVSPRVPQTFDFIEELQATLQWLARQHKKTIVMAQLPAFGRGEVESWLNIEFVPYASIQHLFEGVRNSIVFNKDQSIQQVNARIKALVSRYGNAEFVDLAVVLAREGYDFPIADHQFLYRDAGHINQRASIMLSAAFLQHRAALKKYDTFKDPFDFTESINKI